MSFAGHGNWCGPGWSAGQWKNAEDLEPEDFNVPAIDALDQACKNHDMNIWLGHEDANKIFYEECAALGIEGWWAKNLVQVAGPPSHPYIRTIAGRSEKRAPYVKAFQEQFKHLVQEKEKDNEYAVDANGNSFITPDRPPSRLEPKMTRRDIPLIGYQGRDIIEPVVNLPR